MVWPPFENGLAAFWKCLDRLLKIIWPPFQNGSFWKLFDHRKRFSNFKCSLWKSLSRQSQLSSAKNSFSRIVWQQTVDERRKISPFKNCVAAEDGLTVQSASFKNCLATKNGIAVQSAAFWKFLILQRQFGCAKRPPFENHSVVGDSSEKAPFEKLLSRRRQLIVGRTVFWKLLCQLSSAKRPPFENKWVTEDNLAAQSVGFRRMLWLQRRPSFVNRSLLNNYCRADETDHAATWELNWAANLSIGKWKENAKTFIS